MKHTRTRTQERQWEIDRRKKCHGSIESCLKAHPFETKLDFTPEPVKLKVKGWWQKLLEFLHIK